MIGSFPPREQESARLLWELRREVGSQKVFWRAARTNRLSAFVVKSLLEFAKQQTTAKQPTPTRVAMSAWDDLVGARSPELSRILRPFAHHKNQEIREKARETLARTARDEDARFLIDLLQHSGPAARDILFGMTLGFHTRNEWSTKFSRALQPVLFEIAAGRTRFDRSDLYNVIQVIAKRHGAIGENFLYGPLCLRHDNVLIYNILLSLELKRDEGKPCRTLDFDAVSQVATNLLLVAQKARKDDHTGPIAALGLLFIELLRSDASRASLFIHQAQRTHQAILKNTLKNSPNIKRVIRSPVDVQVTLARAQRSVAQLAPFAQDILHAHELASEVMNDGIELYWHNRGNDWPSAKRGLTVLKFSRLVKQIDASAALLFGSDASRISSLKEIRARLQKTSPATEERLPKIERTIDEDTAKVFAKVEDFISKQPALFAPAKRNRN